MHFSALASVLASLVAVTAAAPSAAASQSAINAAPLNATEALHSLAARGSPQEDRVGALRIHNDRRSQVGVAALVWDDNLQNAAQGWADNLASRGVLEHGSSGENIYWSSAATDHDLQLAAAAWGNEVGNYHGELIPDGNFNGYGHYSEIATSPAMSSEADR